MKRFLSLNKRRTSIFILLFFAIATMAETETALIITPRSGSKQQHALAQIGHVKITRDSLLVFSHENKVLGRNAISNIQYIKYDEYIPNPSGQCGDSLWWEYLPETHTLVFSGSGAMYDLTQSAPWALAGLRDSIWHIQFSDSMTTIANQAFIHCRELTEVTIPNSVTEIHSQAFEQCEGLRKVTLPNNLTQLGANAFNNCYRLSEVNIPASLTEIASGAFYNCDSLSTIQLPNTITRIGSQAFRHIESLVSITLPSSVTYLDDYVFADCWNLESITFSNNITYIGGRVFENCGSLQTVVLPDSLEQILTETFRNCTGLTSVTFPEREVRIGSGLFNSCTSLSHVHLGEGTTSMEAYAFANCTSLHSIVLPSTMSSVEMNAFEYCTGLDTLTSLAKVPPYLGENAFQEVDSMIPFYVPALSARAYRAHERWSYFKNIIGLPCDTTFYAEEDTSICEGNVYVWNDKELTAAGTYIDTLLTEEGCDSIVTFTLHVNRCYVDVNKADTVCVGTTFRDHTITEDNTLFDDTTVTLVPGKPDTITHWTVYIYDNPVPATMYALALTNALPTVKQGCVIDVDPEILINYLNANPATGKSDNVVDVEWQYKINQGDSYEPIDNTMKLVKDVESIIVRYVITETECGTTIIQGGDTVLYTSAYEYRESDEIETQTICDGDSLLWRGHYYSVVGTYKDTITLSEATCNYDSIYTLNLIVNSTYTSEDSASICDSELPYIWHSQEYNETGNYQTTLTSITGCDSVVTLHLTVNPKYTNDTMVTICSSSIPYRWHNHEYDESGIYKDTLKTIAGCDSIIRLNLTVYPSYEVHDTVTICQDETYTWNGQPYTETGDYQTTLEAQNGCDSVVTLHLTVNPTYILRDTVTYCGESFEWRGMSISSSGIFQDSYTTIHNCDSIYELHLTLYPNYTSEESAAVCESELPYVWRNHDYYQTGDYNDTLRTFHGCDSIITLHLTVYPTYVTHDTVTICENEPFAWRGRTLYEEGEYYDTLQTAQGCDSIFRLTLNVNQTYATDITAEICEGESYAWYDEEYTMTGVYQTTLTAFNGCDSVVTLHLTVNLEYTNDTMATICSSGIPFIWHGHEYVESGIYKDTLQTIAGCDSIIRLNLTVYPSYEVHDTVTICQGEAYTWNGQQYTETGDYETTLWAQSGCDSIAHLHLTVLQATDAAPEDWTICESDLPFIWNEKSITEAGVYYDTVRYATGCDSLRRTLNLTIQTAIDEPALDTMLCESDMPFVWREKTITAAGTYYDTTYYETGCNNVHYTLNLTVSTSYSTEESVTICESELPFIWHGQEYYQTGDYETNLISVSGCDSLVTLHLTVNDTYQTTEEAAICEGETYTWHGRALTKKGTYVDTIPSMQGCDSVCTLILTVNEKYLIEDIVSIREDKLPYMWQGERITQAGDYRKEYTSIYGCDSVHTLHLVVTALPIYTVNVIADHGRVNGTGTYAEGTLIHLEAVPDEGFEFQMWSDGSETNPKDFVVMQDTTLRAHFFMPEVEQEVKVDSIETTSVTIVWDTVPGAILYELRIYKNGLLIVTFEVDPDNNIVGVHHIGPDRLVARKDSTGGSSETLQVNVGGLDPGSDYTYSLDAIDDDRSFVGAQSGSFTTEEEETGLRDTLFDDRRPQPRKILQDGHLYIEMPDGTWYSAEGHLLE